MCNCVVQDCSRHTYIKHSSVDERILTQYSSPYNGLCSSWFKNGNSANLLDYVCNRKGNKLPPVFKNVSWNKNGITGKNDIEKKKTNKIVSPFTRWCNKHVALGSESYVD